MKAGADLILKTVKAIENGSAELKPQDDSRVIHAPKIFKEDCRIKWDRSVEEIYNFIRGLSPYPTAFTEFKDSQGTITSLKIFFAEKEFSSQTHANGLLLTDSKTYLKVACKGGYISIKELQLQGKKRMTTAEFLRGYRFPENTLFI